MIRARADVAAGGAAHHPAMGPALDRPEARRCRLQYAAGRIEACPEDACPFWEPGGAVLDGRCAIEQLDLTAGPELVSWLVMLRKDLEGAQAGREPQDAWQLFYRLRDDRLGTS
jgi:hypothetical protein